MSPIRPAPRALTALMVCLLVIGLWQVVEGSWIYAKARLAQYLLQRAWTRTLAGEAAVKPWPWADTWPIARLTVPSQHVDQIVLAGAYGRTLAFGPGFLESTARPGTRGTAIVTGHRDTHFAFLKYVQPGERLTVQSPDGSVHRYRITDRLIVDSRTDKIRLDRGLPSLVLVTCYPFYTPFLGGPLRYIVTADAEMETMGEKSR
jgi:sortase A